MSGRKSAPIAPDELPPYVQGTVDTYDKLLKLVREQASTILLKDLESMIQKLKAEETLETPSISPEKLNDLAAQALLDWSGGWWDGMFDSKGEVRGATMSLPDLKHPSNRGRWTETLIQQGFNFDLQCTKSEWRCSLYTSDENELDRKGFDDGNWHSDAGSAILEALCNLLGPDHASLPSSVEMWWDHYIKI